MRIINPSNLFVFLSGISIMFLSPVVEANNDPGLSIGNQTGNEIKDNRIQPYRNNPTYWQYKGRPVLLIGGSSNDNLFQTFEHSELDRLVSFGGNYLRNTMSSRNEGNLQAFYQDPETGRYDLARWNESYWKKLEAFLDATRERDIIVQLEIWATYDFYTRPSYDIDDVTAWGRNPFNPQNNINYEEAESALYKDFRSTHGSLINPFFMTVMPLAEPFDFSIRPVLLRYQQGFVDKLLSITLNYDHILYVIDNETNTDKKWPDYWSQYIRKAASDRGLSIEVTEMWDTFDPTDGAVKEAEGQQINRHFFSRRATPTNTLKDPQNYSYLDISNHNFQKGEVHFKTGYYIYRQIRKSGIIRPINNTKIYGSDAVGWTGSNRDGMERFWRNIFAGHASVRFHRPQSGLGHSDIAMSHVKSMRLFADHINITRLVPRNDLLHDRSENEAYCLAEEGYSYSVVFMDGGKVKLDVSRLKGERLKLSWLKIAESEWIEEELIRTSSDMVELQTPDPGFWLVVVTDS